MPRFPFRRTPARRSAATRRLVAAGGGFVALALAVQPAAALLSPAGVAVPNTNTASPTAQLAAGPTIVSKLAVPFNPAVAPPAALAGLTSPASPQDDLAGALSSLAADTTPAAVQADRQRALDILEGNAIAGKAYSGIPLLNWNPPAKVKTVPAGGNVVVQDVRFGDQVLSDTWLLSFADPTQPFTITYRVSDLNNTPSELTPTPLLADGATPIGGLNSVVRNLLNDANLDTGTTISNRFATNAPEQTRQTVEDIVVRMPAPRFVSAILDPNLVPGEEGQAALLPATADRLAAATAAFGFSGASP